MKKSALFIVAVSAFLSLNSYGQVYEKVYANSSAEVQQKMNQNKMSGVDILTNIQTHHVVNVSGLQPSQVSELQGLLAAEPLVASSSVNGTSVVIDSKALFTEEKFRNLVQGMNITVTGYTATYSIHE